MSSATFLLYSRVSVQDGHKLRVANQLSRRDTEGDKAHATYVSPDEPVVMELTAFERLEDLPGILFIRGETERGVHPWLAGEWRHEVLAFVEDVVPGEGTLTRSPMVEMRHIEVPPPRYAEYRAWREGTIYRAVSAHPEIDDFRSYQSVLSTEPGVMFVVGFSGDRGAYYGVFQTPEYKAILVEAGSRYIAQGIGGLHCLTFVKPMMLEPARAEAA